MSTHTFFSLCGPSPVATVKVPLSQPCFDHFFGPCFRGHDEAGLLAFEALQGLPRPARGTRTKRGSRGLESIYYGGTPMHHRKTACFGALVLEPDFAQSCGRFLYLHGGRFWRQQVPSPLWWRNLLQVLVRELNHFKQQRKALRQASQLCCFGLQMQFVTVF